MPVLEYSEAYYRTAENNTRITPRPAADHIAWRNRQAISCAEFLADIDTCARALPEATYLINLCTDRYRFMVAFFAAATQRKTTLLPSQRTAEALSALQKATDDCAIVADSADIASDALIDFAPGQNGTLAEDSLSIDPDHTVAIAFTSGSTGTPEAHPKNWRLLCAARATHARYLQRALIEDDDASEQHSTQAPVQGLVATVPSWHMYGLEWAMLLPTIAPFTVFCGADFFPGDIVSALEGFGPDSSNVLISTPVHLRALLKSPPPQARVMRAMSATAPLDDHTLHAVRSQLSTELFEIYGCSEIGSLATRQPGHRSKTQNAVGWEFFDVFDVSLCDDQITVTSDLLPAAITLADRFGRLENGQLALLGRDTDIVKVAGKRESLTHINSVLLTLPGVEDGVVFQPDALGVAGGERLAAFVVGSAVDPAKLRTLLAQRLDAVFVPRPIRVVDALPRDSTSKLKISALRTLAEQFADG